MDAKMPTVTDSQAAVAASTGAEDANLADADDMELLGESAGICREKEREGERERLTWNSENGLQAGIATSVFIGADFRGRIQYHGVDPLDRIDHFVFAAGRTSRHGLGMIILDMDREGVLLTDAGLVHCECSHLLRRFGIGNSRSHSIIAHP